MARTDIRRGGSASRGPGKPPPGKLRRFIKRLFVWGLVLGLMASLGIGVAVALTARSLPSYNKLKTTQTGQMIVVRARDGTVLVSLGPSYGKWTPYAELPDTMKRAMVAVEDRRFRSHPGVDPIGLARAVWNSATTGKSMRATSTITQQLARTVFLNNDRTFSRKAREAILAMALEWNFSKDQILELYLNKVYFGGGAYGVDSASRKFFGHPATNLTLPEAAIIAGLVKAPSHYAPTADSKAAVARAKVVMSAIATNGFLLPGESTEIGPDTVRLTPESGQNSVRYFTDWALPQLDLIMPENDAPIEVWTTLDVGMQRAATTAIAANAPRGAQGALVSLDRDGAVLALVGGTDYVTSNYNRATNAVRQPGSAWKLFVYLTALEAGYKPSDPVVDEPVTIEGWSPHNSGGGYAGRIDIRTAFAFSKNTVAAKLGNEVGFGAVASMARRFGITTPITTVPSMVLGTSNVRLIDMTRAFAGVSAKGRSVEPYGITKVVSTDGKVLYQHSTTQGSLLVPGYVAAGMTDLLQSAVATGTGRAAQIGRPVAGKTGTTTSNKDGWFLGFSSGITTGVWMGRDDARPVTGLQGGHAPARAFAAYMRFAVANRPVERFETEVRLPAWQIESDDRSEFGKPEDYYYVDEQGNFIKPDDKSNSGPGDPPPTEQFPPGDGGGLVDVPTGPKPAANEDFLNEATGGGKGNKDKIPPPPE